jgi:hypothetical protein
MLIPSNSGRPQAQTKPNSCNFPNSSQESFETIRFGPVIVCFASNLVPHIDSFNTGTCSSTVIAPCTKPSLPTTQDVLAHHTGSESGPRHAHAGRRRHRATGPHCKAHFRKFPAGPPSSPPRRRHPLALRLHHQAELQLRSGRRHQHERRNLPSSQREPHDA